jgi:hypothetical protein
MPGMDRKTIQALYMRVCQDSGFQLSFDRAAAVVGDMIGGSALTVWVDMGLTTDVMQQIAAGVHPACTKTRDSPAT